MSSSGGGSGNGKGRAPGAWTPEDLKLDTFAHGSGLALNRTSTRQVRVTDLLVLLLNMQQATRNPHIEHQDAELTYRQLMAYLERFYVKVRLGALEHLLWCANMQAELGEFQQPFSAPSAPSGQAADQFKKFVRDLEDTLGLTFDTDLNILMQPTTSKRAQDEGETENE